MSDNTVTQHRVDEIYNCADIHVDTLFGKCTVMVVKLQNGFVIVESSACVDPDNYNHEIGLYICKDRVKNKIWELEGYKLQSSLYRR